MTSTRLEKLLEMTQQQPQNAFAWYGLAMEYRTQGKLEDAARTFADLHLRHPDYAALFLQYGSTLAQLGEIDRAKQIFEAGIEVCRTKGETHTAEELKGALDELA